MESMELTVGKNTNAFEVKRVLDNYKNIHKTSIVTSDTIRIYFNPDIIAAKRILKYIGLIGKKQTGKRSRNVIKAREMPSDI
jgi:hypothetical protein